MWYQPVGFPWNISPEGCRCIAAEYTDLGDGSISVFNQQVEPNNMYSDACGRACQPDPERPGELFVTFGPTGDSKVLKSVACMPMVNDCSCRLLPI